MTTEHNMEVLDSALQAHLRAESAVNAGDMSFDAVSRSIKTVNRLQDAAVDCGMNPCEPEIVTWVVERITRWMCAA